jgi:DNA replication protein DnaC
VTTTSPATTAPTGRPKNTGRQPSEQAIDAAIDAATRVLRLPTFRDRYAEIADAAGREQLSYRAFLSELLLAECDDREERRAARRIHEAGFPRPKTLAEFDFNANTAINPATINTLAGCGWVSKGQSLCLIGDSGTGKSHLLIGLGTAAAQAGHKVRYVLAAKLVNELVEAADERQLSRTIARYGRVELLCLDELGYMELDKRGAELLFQVLTEREEKTAVAIASNDTFSGWTKTFTDPRLCAAIVDRLTFGGNIIETGTSSYRLAHARTQRQQGGANSSRHSGAKSS